MIIISGGDDSRMKEIIETALTEAGESFTLSEDESDTMTAEQATALMVYNASKVRTYLGRLERNTRKQEEDLKRQADHLNTIAMFLEPVAVYFESKLPSGAPDMPRRTNPMYRVEQVRFERRRQAEDARRRAEEEANS